MTTQRFKTYLVSLVICLFSINMLTANDFLGKASISNDNSATSTAADKKPEPKAAPKPVVNTMTPKTVRSTPFDNFKGHLLRYHNGNFEKVTLDDSNIEYYVFYFSAHWCQPCRKFTPQLIKAYNELKMYLDKLPMNANDEGVRAHKNFEVIFVSWDHSKHDMFDYVKATEMPWLIVDYDQMDNVNVVKNNKLEGIPTLLVFDKTGKLIIGSTEDYISPTKVLGDLTNLIKSQK